MSDGAIPGRLNSLTLLAVFAGGIIYTYDFVAIGIIVPTIQDHFAAGLGSAQWAMTGFSAAIALSVVPAGCLADVYGPDRTFVAGAVGFA